MWVSVSVVLGVVVYDRVLGPDMIGVLTKVITGIVVERGFVGQVREIVPVTCHALCVWRAVLVPGAT